jgi:hypothetical protein
MSDLYSRIIKLEKAIKPLSDHCMQVVFVQVGKTKEQAFAKSGLDECDKLIYVCFVSTRAGLEGT